MLHVPQQSSMIKNLVLDSCVVDVGMRVTSENREGERAMETQLANQVQKFYI